jgi:hypothetical protein
MATFSGYSFNVEPYGEKCFKIFSSEANIANMLSMILRWSTAKIVFSDPDLGPKWPPSADIVLT